MSGGVEMVVRVAIVCLLACVALGPVQAQHERVLKVIDLNADCRLDTIVGIRVEDGWMPRAIVWGRLDSISSCDSNWRMIHHAVTRYRQTRFSFDSIGVRRCWLQGVQLSHDTLADLLISIRGKIKVARNDTIEEQDARIVVGLFSQNGLDTLQELNIRNDTGLVSSAFVAMYYGFGHGAEVAKYLSRSRLMLVTLDRVSFEANEDGGALHKAAAPRRDERQRGKLLLNVAPNPSQDGVIRIRCSQMSGRSNLQVFSINGECVIRMPFPHHGSEEITFLLDLRQLSNGLYHLRVTDESGESVYTHFILEK
ncbi:MAG: T9SS type A sorting domain-containing protein [Candidatus Kapabacteria bacterium]|nr:T9SS type A sorting domain-containing protein [Candidatus Kapabacteria bacterium]